MDAAKPESSRFLRAAYSEAETPTTDFSKYIKFAPEAESAEALKRFVAALSFPLEKRLSSKDATVVTIIAGDFNTDSTDPRFASEQTVTLLRERGFGMVHSFPTTMRKWRCNAVGHKAHGSVSSSVTIHATTTVFQRIKRYYPHFGCPLSASQSDLG